MPPRAALLTSTEAAVLTGLAVKAVNNAIDKKTASAATGEGGGRLIDARALLSLSIERRLADRIAPELRREVFAALKEGSSNVVSLEGGLLKIDPREPRRALARSLRDLRRARRLVVSDSEILGGEPVFRGTRVPVHMIAGLVSRSSTEAELQDDYPRLTPEMIRLAPVYTGAYPPRGRPRKQPWHNRQPARSLRRRIHTIALP